MWQVVVAEACTSLDRRAKPGLCWRTKGSAGDSISPFTSQPSIAHR